jgi:hypothetical protein
MNRLTKQQKRRNAAEDLREEADQYRAALDEARNVVAEVVQVLGAFWCEQSEDWKAGVTGQAFREWVEAWNCTEFDEVEIDEPEVIDVPKLGETEQLEDLPEAAS